MEFVRICSPDEPEYGEAMKLYKVSFPEHEQRTDAAQRTVMGKESYNFDLICEDGSFVGDIFYWESEDFIYVEHFCIVPDMRGGGLGKRALELLGENGNSRDRSSGGQRVGTPPRFLSPCGIQDEFHRTHSSSVQEGI